MPAENLRLRPLRLDDEAAFAAAHAAMKADAFEFGLGYASAPSWARYVATLDAWRRDIDVPPGYVASTFLVAVVAGEIVGRTSIRHELNEFLAREGGHIGYGVLAPYRRRGYATEILRQSLVIVRSVGVDRVLVTCDDDNVGSAAVIERGGGVFESLIEPAAGGTRSAGTGSTDRPALLREPVGERLADGIRELDRVGRAGLHRDVGDHGFARGRPSTDAR